MKRQNLLLAGVSAWAVASAGALMAQDTDVVHLGTIYVSAVRSNAEASAIPGSVQVIDASDLERRISDGQSLERVLADYIPGLSPSNGTVAGASQNLRGRRLEIMIDGISRTSELRGFNRDLGLLDVNSIERIEVIRGSSAQFGNGATGGLINIITKDAGDAQRTTLTTRLSAQEESVSDSLAYEVALSHERRVNDLGLRFELTTSGVNDRFGGSGDQLPSDPLVGQGGGDNNEKISGAVAADYAWGANTLDLRLDVSRFEQTPEFFTNYLTDPVSVDLTQPYTGQPVTDDTNALNLTWTNDALSIGELEVQTWITDNERVASFVPAGIANPLYYPTSPVDPTQRPDSQSVLTTKTHGIRSTVRSDLSTWIEGAQLTWGFDYGHDDVTQTLLDGTDIIAPMKQDSYAAFAQVDLPVGDSFELSAGVRYERFDLNVSDFTRPDAVQLTPGGPVLLPAVDVTGGDFDYDATVFNIGGVWHVSPDVEVFAGYSQGFSVPDVGSFTRRAMPSPNPTLPDQTVSFASIAPEAQIVETFEIGTRYSTGALDLTGSVFLSKSDDGTTFDPATNTLSQQKEEIWGAELTVDYAASDALNLGMIAAFTEGRFDSDNDGSIDNWLPNNRISSPFTATFYGDYHFDSGLTLAGEVVYTGEREHAGLSKVEETARVNIRASKSIANGDLSVGIDNLFDSDYLNPTASVVRRNPLTGADVPVAGEGRRIWAAWTMEF